MRVKRIPRLFAILLIILSLSLVVFAADEKVKVTIDLSAYPNAMKVNESIEGSITDFQISAKTTEVRTYDAVDDVVIRLYPSEETPVREWNINGERYTLPENNLLQIDFSDQYVTVYIKETYLEIAIAYPEMDEEWTISPVVSNNGFTAIVTSSDDKQGSVLCAKKAENEFELTATASSGYSFNKADSPRCTV